MARNPFGRTNAQQKRAEEIDRKRKIATEKERKEQLSGSKKGRESVRENIKEQKRRKAESESKPTIQLNQPKENLPQKPNEEGTIDLTAQGQRPEETTRDKVVNVAKAVGVGAAIGTGAFLAGGAIVGLAAKPLIKVSAATMNTIRNKLLAKEISTKLGTFGGSVVGKTTEFISKTAPAATNFASNTKTISLTKKLLIGAGISLGVASIAKDILGTYPFASFGKEETLQSISFAMNAAIKEGLFEEAQGLLDASNEIVNAAPNIASKIPYANVQKEFTNFATQQAENNKVWQEVINKQVSEMGQESDFAEERRKSDEESTQRKLEEQALDSEYFTLIREKKFEEAEELLQSRLKGEE